MQKQKGFTVVEIIVVIAIIAGLAGIVMVGVNNTMAKAKDSRRKSEMRGLQKALAMYYGDNGSFPSTGMGWYSSEPGDFFSDNGGNYIPGITPTYLSALPRDPQGGTSKIPSCGSNKAAYLYISDGINYKLLSHCAPNSFPSAGQPFYDPVRPTWAWMVCSGDTTICNTW
ncbi:MAG: prepilin-type N-terminal cleavage/methylation domain-containing protein [Candidatus Staskawiczbacteria bacterium]|nr:prepilin-type N-terminal cleavage/methylation domain-containing protein [Candidatus Staskawiczbacteria bacterium]